MLGLAVAATAQITGVLLVFALLAAPAAAAQQLTARPLLGLALDASARARRDLGSASALAYFTDYPVGFSSPRSAFAALRRALRAAAALAARSGADARRTSSSATRSSPGRAIALACGLVGYFVVLRAQVFAGDALSHVAFTGALAAALAGHRPAARPVRGDDRGRAALRARSASALRADDVAIGVVFAWVLGLGVLFLYLFNRSRAARTGSSASRTLFGSIFGLTAAQARVAPS